MCVLNKSKTFLYSLGIFLEFSPSLGNECVWEDYTCYEKYNE